jgi:hypothetical protein
MVRTPVHAAFDIFKGRPSTVFTFSKKLLVFMFLFLLSSKYDLLAQFSRNNKLVLLFQKALHFIEDVLFIQHLN